MTTTIPPSISTLTEAQSIRVYNFVMVNGNLAVKYPVYGYKVKKLIEFHVAQFDSVYERNSTKYQIALARDIYAFLLFCQSRYPIPDEFKLLLDNAQFDSLSFQVALLFYLSFFILLYFNYNEYYQDLVLIKA
jgi:hypothetical protein